MANRVSASDRKLLVGTVALLLLLSLLMGSAGVPDGSGEAGSIPSTYSTNPGGAAAAFDLLQDLHYSVRRWEESPARLPDSDPDAVLILAEPTSQPTTGERAYLRRFVEQGGRILFCGGSLNSFFQDAKPTFMPDAATDQLLSPDLPSPFTRGVKNMTIQAGWSWKERGADQIALFGGTQDPVAVIWRLGRGEVLWWAAATPLTNDAIAKADNMIVFLDAVSSQSPSHPRPVYWDEYFHGARGSLWSYVETTPLRWVLLQSLLLFGALVFAFSRRSGPTVIPRGVSRLSPLEFVDTMGGLYQRAGATSVATGVVYRHLRLNLTRRLLLPAVTPNATLAHAAAQRLGWNFAELSPALEHAESSQNRNLRPADALDLVKTIGYYLDRLENSRASTETK